MPLLERFLVALRHAGVQTVHAAYSGSDDEGFVDRIQLVPPTTALTEDLLEDLGEEMLQVVYGTHGGWELNEGSHGLLTLDVATGRVTNPKHLWH